MKNAAFCDVALCRYCVNRRFGGMSIHTRSTLHRTPEDDIIRNNSCLATKQRESFISYAGKYTDRLCGLVVRVPSYRSRGTGFNSRRYQFF
jgi:hypothetical protein